LVGEEELFGRSIALDVDEVFDSDSDFDEEVFSSRKTERRGCENLLGAFLVVGLGFAFSLFPDARLDSALVFVTLLGFAAASTLDLVAIDFLRGLTAAAVALGSGVGVVVVSGL